MDDPTSTAAPHWPPVAGRAIGRFVPGTLLASRYRVVALLGAGGMGEVYRADDLTLGQPVALKFLPPELANRPDRLARFRAEVRTARQVSHPNVCRVYDISEAEGLPFLSMEYVDGEDLASLLRRIGRLPEDKGVEIARQLCAGLAAAHDRGVLHRDLKPANVMIDGRGHARITDFGIATIIGGRDQLAGTPAYLAPELLAGQPPSVKSDIFALGLVLHEIFTGKPVFASADLLEIAQAHRERSASGFSTTSTNVDPLIQRLISRCLDPNPDARPASALAVAAALPGADPLAAALERGETPAPELVAAAGGEGALSPAMAATLFATAMLLLVVAAWAYERTSLINIAPMPLRPDVLRDRAELVLRQSGYTETLGDVASGFETTPFATYVLRRAPPGRPWEEARQGQPSALRYWYRTSPGPLIGERFASGGRVSSNDPSPERTIGMRAVHLDTQGRLLHLLVVPPRNRLAGADSLEPDWTALFVAAGLDQTKFREVTSEETPPEHADTRRAWAGVYPESPDIPIRIEAAAARGLPIYFRIVEPWMGRQPAARTPPRFLALLRPVVYTCAISLGVWLAFRNLRLGRGDTLASKRIGITIFGLALAGGFLGADFAPNMPAVRDVINRLFTSALASGAMTAMFYLALEPPVRRRWPHVLIGSTRLLHGSWQDPRVGREVLIGVLAACLVLVLPRVEWLAASLAGLAPNIGFIATDPSLLDGSRFLASRIVEQVVNNTLGTFITLLVIFTLMIVLRRPWIAVAVGATIMVVSEASISPTPRLTACVGAFSMVLYFSVLLRVGLLAHVMAGTLITTGRSAPLTLEASAWYAPYGWLIIAVIVIVGVYGFRASLGGRPLFQRPVLAE